MKDKKEGRSAQDGPEDILGNGIPVMEESMLEQYPRERCNKKQQGDHQGELALPPFPPDRFLEQEIAFGVKVSQLPFSVTSTKSPLKHSNEIGKGKVSPLPTRQTCAMGIYPRKMPT